MEFIKKYKYPIIIVFVLMILALLAFLAIRLLYPDGNKSLYGNRLNGIEKVTISNTAIDKVKDSLPKDKVSKIDHNIKGRVVNFIIYVKSECDLPTARAFSDKVIAEFSKEQQKFYDFQIFLISENKENKAFPSIGYRHKTSEVFKWNNN